MWGMKTEPAAVTFALRCVIYALIAFELIGWTEQQVGALLIAVDAVLTLLVRGASTSQATLEKAGLSQAEVVERAER